MSDVKSSVYLGFWDTFFIVVVVVVVSVMEYIVIPLLGRIVM